MVVDLLIINWEKMGIGRLCLGAAHVGYLMVETEPISVLLAFLPSKKNGYGFSFDHKLPNTHRAQAELDHDIGFPPS